MVCYNTFAWEILGDSYHGYSRVVWSEDWYCKRSVLPCVPPRLHCVLPMQPRLVLVPLFNGYDVVLYDIYYNGEWLGSGRTFQQAWDRGKHAKILCRKDHQTEGQRMGFGEDVVRKPCGAT